MPPLVEYLSSFFVRDPLEVRFVYPKTQGALGESMFYFLFDFGLFFLGFVAGLGLLKGDRWAWFAALALS